MSGPRPGSAVGRAHSRSRSRSRGELANGHNQRDGGKGFEGAVKDEGGDVNDFCNAFWGRGLGVNDEGGSEAGSGGSQSHGYEALLGRMKNAGKTLEELKVFFRERCVYSTDASAYSRRLTIQAITGHLSKRIMRSV